VKNLPNHARERVYPLRMAAAEDGHRFTLRFVEGVARVIVGNGYPPVIGADFEALHESMRTFLYGPAWCPGAPADLDAECGRPGPHPPHLVLTGHAGLLCAVDERGWCSVHEGFHADGGAR
jgi:hypothetical protein